MIKQLISLAGFILITFMAPAISGLLAVAGPGEWYRALQKPWLNPPNWIFGPVWTLLYCMMGIAAWLIWRKNNTHAIAIPMSLFFIQLILNALWTPLFFGLHRLDLSLIEILFLWAAIAATTLSFYGVSKPAALLFVPYWCWVSFASYLNAAYWWLNRN